jgi:hypothetical protein
LASEISAITNRATRPWGDFAVAVALFLGAAGLVVLMMLEISSS